MKVHHLNCATFCPVACQRFFSRSHFIAHCLLIESDDGLILVDTGYGSAECTERGARVGRIYAALMRPAFDPAETAAAQVRALGFSTGDVRHIVVTHMDGDHAGGLPDFPEAQVHIFADEHAAIMKRATIAEKGRYLPAQWAHEPQWRIHAPADGERWHGFDLARPIAEVSPELLLVPVTGHTRGHCVVAVDDGDGWLVHCGDAYFDRRSIAAPDAVPKGIRRMERALALDYPSYAANHERLRALQSNGGEGMRLFCAHDPAEFPAPTAASTPPGDPPR